MSRILTVWLFTVSTLAAQSTRTATLVGTVTDPSGAFVVGAKVTVVNTETQFTYTGETTSNGDYYIPYLVPGPYQLKVEAAGFRTYVRSGIVLRVGESPRIDIQLEIGNITESVTVTGAVPLLETETAAAGGLMENRTFIRIPVLQMRTYNIMIYLPGLAVTGFNAFNVIGQRSRSMGYTLDGVSAKDPVFATSVSHTDTVQTSTDALQEVKLLTTGVPAEFGRAGAGVLVAVFKSGTNELHGSAEDRCLQRSRHLVAPLDFARHLPSRRLQAPEGTVSQPGLALVLRIALSDQVRPAVPIRPHGHGSSHRAAGRDHTPERSPGQEGPEQFSAARRPGLDFPAQAGFPQQFRRDDAGPAQPRR